jgi:hypothetical protein
MNEPFIGNVIDNDPADGDDNLSNLDLGHDGED